MFCPHSRVDTSTSALRTTKFRRVDRVAHQHFTEHPTPPATPGHNQTASILECAAITLAAGVLTEQQVATARRTNELLRQSSQTTEQGISSSLARQFHNGLLEACPNAHMVALLQSQSAAGSILQHTSPMTDAAIRRAADDHDEILSLIERGASSRTIERFLSKHMTESTGCAATH